MRAFGALRRWARATRADYMRPSLVLWARSELRRYFPALQQKQIDFCVKRVEGMESGRVQLGRLVRTELELRAGDNVRRRPDAELERVQLEALERAAADPDSIERKLIESMDESHASVPFRLHVSLRRLKNKPRRDVDKSVDTVIASLALSQQDVRDQFGWTLPPIGRSIPPYLQPAYRLPYAKWLNHWYFRAWRRRGASSFKKS